MYVEALGTTYYLDEESFAKRMTQAAKEHPWRMEEVVAIQHQMKSVEDRIFEHVRRSATPDPMETLRRHIDKMSSS